ncbi:Ankyrin repeat-containing domain [Penicillium camemberti]|uniref:Ankyrin repeat-containing domain n=1 Tax=Penicillium camemberti (strain FM 013) TaxID=1429867 RepID=A0A0G4PXG4_PENC3|nr:Ankyrin repeat-containing domain [Penicillium camemberti]
MPSNGFSEKKGLDLNVHDRKGYTPLHLAFQSKRPEMVNLHLSHPRVNVNCTDKYENTPLWLSTCSLCDEITERLLADKDINVYFVRGRGRFETPSTSLHHATTRLDTVILRRLLAVPRVDPNLCVAGHSAAYHRRMNTFACLLSIEGVEINGRDMIDPPLCRAVANGHLDVVRQLMQQGTRLNINESTIASHDTALCIAARGGDLEMVQALLCHDQIDVNLRNRWFEDPLMLAVKGGHSLVVSAQYLSLRRSVDLARNDCIQGAIRSRIEDDNTPQTFLKRSPRRSFGSL